MVHLVCVLHVGIYLLIDPPNSATIFLIFLLTNTKKHVVHSIYYAPESIYQGLLKFNFFYLKLF